MDAKRRAKWGAKLRGFRDAADGQLTREQVASAHGIMQRVALVFPLGRAWLYGVRRLLAAAHLSPKVRMGPEVREDIQVYIDFLGLEPGDCPPTPALTRHGPRRASRTISDASFQALSGATLRDDGLEYWVHVLTDDELAHVGTARDEMHITRLELVAAAHNLLIWPPGQADHVEMVADNMAACEMINAGVARRDPVCNAALQTISRVLRGRGATIAAVHVPTDENWICDTATRTNPARFAAFLQRTYPGLATRRVSLQGSPLRDYLPTPPS